jgi:hypothetical protein
VAAAFAILIAVGTYLFGIKLELTVEKMRSAQTEIEKSEKDLQTLRATANQVQKDVKQAGTDLNLAIVGAKTLLAVIRRNELRNADLWPNGATLRIGFFGGSLGQRANFQQALSEWLRYANLHADYVAVTDAQVRVSFLPQQGSWSAIGTDCLTYPPDRPTVNFGSQEPGGIYLRFAGYVLGLVREPLNPMARLHWNRDAVYKAFKEAPLLHWTRDQVDSVFFWPAMPYPGSRPFDPNSIMMVDLPAKFFTDLKEFKAPSTLSPSDKQYIATLYPK